MKTERTLWPRLPLRWLAPALVLLVGAPAALARKPAPRPTERALPAPASARLPSVYLVPVQRSASNVSSLIPRRITARLRVDLGAQQDIEVLTSLVEATSKGTGKSIYKAGARPEPDRRRAAKKTLKQGLAAYKGRRYADAQKLLLKSLRLFEVSAAHLEDGDQLGTVFGYLGLAFLRQGKTAMAADAIETAYAINPTLKLEKVAMSRKMRRVVMRAGRKALRRRKAKVTIKVEPPGAWVFLDGDEKGKAPHKVKGVLPGRHYIAARMKGRHARSVVVNIKPGTNPTFTLKLPDATPQFKSGKGLEHAFLAEIQKRLSAGLVDRKVKPLASQLAKRLRADFLLLGAVSRAKQGGYTLRSYLFRSSDRKLVELDSYNFDGELLNLAAGTSKVSDAAATATADFPAKRDITYVSVPRLRPGGKTGTGRPGGLVGVVPGGQRTVHSTAKPWYLRWALWGTVIGVVVVGAIAGGSVGLYKATHQESKGYRITVNVP